MIFKLPKVWLREGAMLFWVSDCGKLDFMLWLKLVACLGNQEVGDDSKVSTNPTATAAHHLS